MECFESVCRLARSQCPPSARRACNSCEIPYPQILKFKQITQKLSCVFRDNHVSGLAIAWRCAARFGGSPMMPHSCAPSPSALSPTTTRPVAIPTLVCNGVAVFSAATVATNSNAARTARSGRPRALPGSRNKLRQCCHAYGRRTRCADRSFQQHDSDSFG